jgi:O-methyltransferase
MQIFTDSFLKKMLNNFGIKIKSYHSLPPDFSEDIRETIVEVREFTQTSPERINTLCEATKYIALNNIPGDIVECGVWRGGSIMAVARTLLNLGNTSRELYLFDTFEGMTEPTSKDISIDGQYAGALLRNSNKHSSHSVWCYSSLEEVKAGVERIGYDSQKIHYIKGKVEDTIPGNAPEKISLLRLDTDWYESTHHEMVHLFPRLSNGGVIIIDDYGHWKGARKAVDEYITDHKIKILLNRIDYTGRIGIKIGTEG